MIETFWLEPTDRERRFLRRHGKGPCPPGASGFSYHNAQLRIEDGPFQLSQRKGDERPYHYSPDPRTPPYVTDQRWLQIARCSCGHEFTSADPFQIFTEAIYTRRDTGEETTIRDAPAGALWVAWWMPDRWQGDDGQSVACKLPGGHSWLIDHQASNCTRPGEQHHCWVRHGTVGDRLTVDKNGNTCAAGGGSIWVHKPVEWHGFLREGFLKETSEV